MLILNNGDAWHWALGGLAIGAITLVLLAVANRRLGISTGFENICSLVVQTAYLRRDEIVGSHSWRLPFLGGLLLGGAASAMLSGGLSPTWDLGMFDQVIGGGPTTKLAWMFVGGIFIGFGTRMAGGCTSGHGIFGLSNFEKASLVSTLAFMATGAITTNIIYRVIFAN